MPVRMKSSPSISARRARERYRLPVRLLGCFCLVAIATLFGGTIDNGLFLWVANGVLLAYLLLAPRRLWPHYLAAGFLAHVVVGPMMLSGWSLNVLFIPHDTFEVLLAALLLRRRSSELPVLTNAFYLLRFATCALLIAPFTTALIYSLISALWFHTKFSETIGVWFLADSLGILVTAPAFVPILRSSLRESGADQKEWLIVFPAIAFIALFLSQSKIPGPPLLFPILIFILLYLGLGWASFVTLATAAIATWFTAHGIGPFAPSPTDQSPSGLRLQIYIIAIMIMLYSVSVVIENLRKTERRLQQIASLHALVAENSRDVIVLLDFEGGRNFISTPKYFWGGWTRDEILACRTLELTHPDDSKTLVATLNDLRSKKDTALIEVRTRRKDSSYGWLEFSLRTVRDPISNLPTGVLAVIREITERKHAEQQLEDAFHAVEALSITDALTGLANRRRFDQVLAAEWRRALREQNPISLLLIDADHFKDFNDTYGHPGGDTCLKFIASAVRSGANRASDLAARIGGEEFAVILPNTSGKGARGLAKHICEQLHTYGVPHAGNPAGVATISIGCATVVPQPGQAFSLLVDRADHALYSAKHAGRNCIHPSVSDEENEQLAMVHEHLGLA